MKRAVAYARFSTDMQREESIDAQFRAIREYCQRNDIVLVNFYQDEGISGTSDDRPAFQEMIKASDAGRFDYVVVHKLDRFSRSKYDSAIYKRKLKENGVRVLSVLENLDDSPESLILESVLEGMSEYFSRNLSREVRKGMKENALKGKFNGGTPPLGYDVDENRDYVINPWEARAVKMIFTMYADGYSYKDIMSRLNQDGYKTKKGKKFGKNSLFEILRNEKYIGNYIYSREDYDGFAKKRNNHREKPRDKQIIIENKIPRIIDENTWTVVHDRRKKNKRSGSMKENRIYILSGLISCAKCGEKMVGTSRRSSTGKLYYYYRCNQTKGGKSCSSINAEKMEKEVKKYFDDLIFTKHNRSVIADAMEQYSRIFRDTKRNKDKIDYNQELLDTNKQINNIVDAIAAGISNETLNNKLGDLEKKKQAILAEMDSIISSEKLDTALRDKIDSFLSSHSSIEEYNPIQQKTILSLFIESIVYEDHSAKIKLRMIDPEVLSRGFNYGAGKRT